MQNIRFHMALIKVLMHTSLQWAYYCTLVHQCFTASCCCGLPSMILALDSLFPCLKSYQVSSANHASHSASLRNRIQLWLHHPLMINGRVIADTHNSSRRGQKKRSEYYEEVERERERGSAVKYPTLTATDSLKICVVDVKNIDVQVSGSLLKSVRKGHGTLVHQLQSINMSSAGGDFSTSSNDPCLISRPGELELCHSILVPYH